MVFVEPYQLVSQTSSSRRRRLMTAPGSRARAVSRSNSFGVNSSSWPPSRTRRARLSSSSSPTWTMSFSGAVPRPRLVTARIRDQLAYPERLDHVVVGAELKADDTVSFLSARRDDDDRNVGSLTDLAAD